jgi:RNA polymerase sigma-70 factor (ECF subfamily)
MIRLPLRHPRWSLCKECDRLNFSGANYSILAKEARVSTAQQLYEQTLVVRSQLGDEAAFRELLELYAPRLFAFVNKMISSDQVDDLMQEIWISVYRGLPGLRDSGSFHPWLFRIARDRVYREYRKRRLPLQSIDETVVEDQSAPEAPEEDFDREQLRQQLQNLSPEHREVLILHYLEEMSYDDIARVTGANLGTVRSRLHYAKRILKRKWKDHERRTA